MSNILYRMQIVQQEDEETRIIDSNEILESFIQERKKKEEKSQRFVKETAEREEDTWEGEVYEFQEFTQDLEQEMQEEESLEPEIDYVALAKEEAEQILQAAQNEAQQVLQDAMEQAEAMKSHATEEGQKQGYDHGIQEAAALQAQWEQEALQARQALEQEYLEKQKHMEKDLLQVVCDIVEKVFLVQFQDKQDVLLHLLDNAVSNIEGSKEFLIRVNEANCEFLRNHKAQLQDKVGQEVVLDIVQDPLLDDGQCMIETDGGLFDCGMDTQMKNLIKEIKSLS